MGPYYSQAQSGFTEPRPVADCVCPGKKCCDCGGSRRECVCEPEIKEEDEK